MKSRPERLEEIVIRELKYHRDLISRGKKKWPDGNFVTDDLWTGWEYMEHKLLSILWEAGYDSHEFE